MIKSEDDKLIEEARKALLQHYSSKSTLQATILLSLAIAFFAFIQTIPLYEQWNHLLLSFFYSIVLTAFIFITVRAFGRLIYWGKMAGIVGKISVISKEEAQIIIEKEKEEESVPTSLYRAVQSCDGFLERSRVHAMFRKLTNKLFGGFILCCLLFCSFFTFFTFFLISNVIVIMIMVCILAFLAFILLLYLKKSNKKKVIAEPKELIRIAYFLGLI